jgi:hypothetical protein
MAQDFQNSEMLGKSSHLIIAITSALLSLNIYIKVQWKAENMPLVMSTNLTFDSELIKSTALIFLKKYSMYHFNHLKAFSASDNLVIIGYYNT